MKKVVSNQVLCDGTKGAEISPLLIKSKDGQNIYILHYYFGWYEVVFLKWLGAHFDIIGIIIKIPFFNLVGEE